MTRNDNKRPVKVCLECEFQSGAGGILIHWGHKHEGIPLILPKETYEAYYGDIED